MKKVVKLICLLLIAGLIAILVLKNGASAAGEPTITPSSTTLSEGDNVTITIHFPENVTSFNGYLTSSDTEVLSRNGGSGIQYGIGESTPKDTFTYTFHAEGAGTATITAQFESVQYESGPEAYTITTSPITVTGGGSTPVAPTLTVDHSSVQVGSNATVSVSNGVNVTWNVSGNLETIGESSSSITVKGTAAGTGTVTASAGENLTASQQITITDLTPPDDETPSVSISNGSLVVGGNPTTVTSDKAVNWSSTDTTVATISSNSDYEATVVPTGVGTCQIVGVLKTNANKTASVDVSVAEAPAPEPGALAPRVFPSANMKIFVGQSATLDADQSVTWSSSDSSIASVNGSGEITGKGEGTATISATSKSTGLSTTKTITVAKAASGEIDTSDNTTTNEAASTASTIAISPNKNQTIKIGEAIQFKVTKGTVSSWESSKKDVASVDNTGNVKALKTGTTVISAISSDGALVQVKVKVVNADGTDANTTTTTNETVPATGEAPTELLVVIGAITFVIAVFILRKKTK